MSARHQYKRSGLRQSRDAVVVNISKRTEATMKLNQLRNQLAGCPATAHVNAAPRCLIRVSAVVKRRLLGLPTLLLPLLLLLLALPAVVQAQFNYTANNGTITITGYSGSGGVVIIPATINGLPVTSIGVDAFQGNSSLTSVTIPNSVTSIGSSAFRFCTGLTSVLIPSSVTSIGSGVFVNCTSLASVTIPNSVASIGPQAFLYCTSLTSVSIPSSVTSIGYDTFAGCTSLTAITVDADNSSYGSADGALFDKSLNTLMRCPGGKTGNYTIPGSITSIGQQAFDRCASLTSITIPSSVTSFGFAAFANCTSLTSITIPGSVTSFGGTVFRGCTSLTSVTIGSGVTSFGVSAFRDCTSLTNITIPNSVTNIPSASFQGCTSLTNVTIPSNVTSIGDQAFYGCTSLNGVYFQGNAPSVGFSVFSSADNATVYYLPGTAGWGLAFGGRPTALWKPQVQTSDGSFGLRTNQFGFNIAWASGQVVVVEAATNLSNSIWSPLQTNTLTADTLYFSDPQWTNYPSRFYRIRSP